MDDELIVEQFLVSLYEIGIIQDRKIEIQKAFTFPKIHKQIIELLWNKIQPLHYDLICGRSQNSLVLASSLSISKSLPMITCQDGVEGEFFAGQYCLLIEDVVGSKEAVIEAIHSLEAESIVVEDIICFIDLEEGERQKLEGLGYRVHPVLKRSDISDVLFRSELTFNYS